jgi:enolase
MMNVINGGAHADSGLSFQECMIVPTDFSSFSEALRAGAEIFHTLKKILKDLGHVTAVGDEGGFAPHVKDSHEALSLLMRAIGEAGYLGKVQLALDCAASEFYKDGVYTVDGKQMTSSELVDFYGSLISSFPIVSIEDSHSEDDWTGFTEMQSCFGERVQLVGDDLFVTNVERVQKGIEMHAANAVLIKVNQIGTLSETVDTIQLCQKNGWNSIASHRSGETEDSFIADLAVGLATGQIKTGSLSRTDRICKYNQLLRIEEELGDKAEYAKVFH